MARGPITAVDWIGRLRVTDYTLLGAERCGPGGASQRQSMHTVSGGLGAGRDYCRPRELRLNPAAVNCSPQHCLGSISTLFEEYTTNKVQYSVILALLRLRLLTKVEKLGNPYFNKTKIRSNGQMDYDLLTSSTSFTYRLQSLRRQENKNNGEQRVTGGRVPANSATGAGDVTTNVIEVNQGNTSDERSEFFCVYRKNLSMRGPIRPGQPDLAHADAFQRLISPRLWIRFPYGLHTGRFKPDHSRIWLIWGVTLAGSACRVKDVKIGRYA